MPYTIQLDVDRTTEARLKALAMRMEQEGAERTVHRLGDVHHLSLGVYEELPAATLADELRSFAGTIHPLTVILTSVGTFPAGVIYLAPAADAFLLELHGRFHSAFAPHRHSCWPPYLPGAWVPHVTLALDVPQGSLTRLVDGGATQWAPVDARLDALRLVRFHPVETLWQKSIM